MTGFGVRFVGQAATIAGTQPVDQDFLSGTGPNSADQPDAALYELSGVTTLGTPASTSRYGVGMTDGTLQRSIAFLAENAASASLGDTGNRFDIDTVFQLSLTGVETSRDGEANWGSWQTGGSRVAWSDLLASALRTKATHFFGTEGAAVKEFTGNATQNSSSSVTGLSFAPNFAIIISHYAVFSADGTSQNGRISIGYAVKTPAGAIQQIAFTKYCKDRAGLSTANAAALHDDCCLTKITDAADGATLELTAWNSDGATFTTRRASEAVTCAILFMRIPRKLWCGIPSLVTSSTGVKTIADPGFPVQSYFCLATALTAKNTTSLTGSGDGWSHGGYSGSEESLFGGFEPDAGTPTTFAVAATKIAQTMLTTAPTYDWSAVHSALTATGFQINVDDPSGADRVAGFVAIGTEESTGALTVAHAVQSGAVAERFSASGALAVAHAVELGSVAEKFATSGTLVRPPATHLGSAAEKFLASGVILRPPAAHIGAALERFAASGSVVRPPTIELGSALEKFTTSGADARQSFALLGSSSEQFVSTGAIVRPPIMALGSIAEKFLASGAFQSAATALLGSATTGASATFTSTGAFSVAAAVLSAQALERFAASGNLPKGSTVLSGVSAERFSASGVLLRPPAVEQGSALERFDALGAESLGPAALQGLALVVFACQGDQRVPHAVLSGAVLERFLSTGQLTVPHARLSGTDAEAIFDLVLLQAGRRVALTLLAGRRTTFDLDAARRTVYDLDAGRDG